jgi:hypothetical protein
VRKLRLRVLSVGCTVQTRSMTWRLFVGMQTCTNGDSDNDNDNDNDDDDETTTTTKCGRFRVCSRQNRHVASAS